MSSNAIGDILEWVHGSVLESIFRAYLRVYKEGSVALCAIRSVLELARKCA
jgi:hypothetical protein